MQLALLQLTILFPIVITKQRRFIPTIFFKYKSIMDNTKFPTNNLNETKDRKN